MARGLKLTKPEKKAHKKRVKKIKSIVKQGRKVFKRAKARRKKKK